MMVNLVTYYIFRTYYKALQGTLVELEILGQSEINAEVLEVISLNNELSLSALVLVFTIEVSLAECERFSKSLKQVKDS